MARTASASLRIEPGMRMSRSDIGLYAVTCDGGNLGAGKVGVGMGGATGRSTRSGLSNSVQCRPRTLNGMSALWKEFDVAPVSVDERHHHEFDLRVIVDVDARSDDDRRGGTAADYVAGDSGECVGGDVGN